MSIRPETSIAFARSGYLRQLATRRAEPILYALGYDVCPDVDKWLGDMTVGAAWVECHRGDWMASFLRTIGVGRNMSQPTLGTATEDLDATTRRRLAEYATWFRRMVPLVEMLGSLARTMREFEEETER